MNIQSETVRRYVLEHLEDGSFSSGMRLPGFRKIADELNISRPVVQNALNTLVNEGVLRAVPRSGLYVDDDWQSRQVRGTLGIFASEATQPWLKRVREELGGPPFYLHISKRFYSNSPWTIITTTIAQAQQAEFVDLKPILKTVYPDLSPFSVELLRPFTRNGRLFALPFVYSPRLIACNRKMLHEAGCPDPSPDWMIGDLEKLIRKLRRHFPPERLFNQSISSSFWINFVLSCGGELFDSRDPGKVAFDSPEALEGFRIAKLLHSGKTALDTQPEDCALIIIDRQTARRLPGGMKGDWLFLPIPGNTPDRTGISMQATELFAVRHGWFDSNLVAPVIRYLWSKQFQDHLAELQYGIPIRKSSASRAFDDRSRHELMFRECCPKIRNDYQLHDPHLSQIVFNGIGGLLSRNGGLKAGIGELADFVRQYIKFTEEP